jgi:hypothetical protein
LEFKHAKSNKSLAFAELICDLPSTETENVVEDFLPNKSIFLISYDDVWYRDIIIYIQTQNVQPNLSSTDHCQIQYQAYQYIILSDTLYHVVLTPFFDDALLTMELRKI